MKFDKLSLFFGAILLLSAGCFYFWGMDHIQSGTTILFTLALIFGLFMAFNIGGNDVANSFGTSVGAGTLTMRQALIVAAVFEVSGAMLAGGKVTKTIRSGIVDLNALAGFEHFNSMDLAFLMMAALLASGVWILLATKFGLPVSTTHSIVGGIIGSAIALGVVLQGVGSAFDLVQWKKMGFIAICWVVAPVLGALVAYGVFLLIKRTILHYNVDAERQLRKIQWREIEMRKGHKAAYERMAEVQRLAYTQAMARDADYALSDEEPREENFESDYYRDIYRLEKMRESVDARRALEVYMPILAALGAFVICSMLFFKGLDQVIDLTFYQKMLVVTMISVVVWLALSVIAKSQKDKTLSRSTLMLFNWMQVFTACAFAFSHGSNDISNAIGPFAAVLDVLRDGQFGTFEAPPAIAMFAFAVALCAGLWFIGKEVIQTVGTSLTELHPASGFSAELSAAAVVMLATVLGLPVSSTHILVGAVLGIGIVNRAANWRLMRPIFLAWIVTIPASAIMSVLAFFGLRTVLG